MSYFQGGDFVELLSAQGKSPAAAWKLQGKISKTFDKGIKGNAFSLDGNAETKMQLPKTMSSSLALAQRFVILQLLVPFTRSFSVEICFSDFQKVRRRFVVASAFRDTARTALHVQLPLNVPRDQWMNLVFDLQTLSEVHFPDSGYRSMESICISGSCRLKRIFTMKDAPTPSRGSQVVKHADISDIPRQFVFSATQKGASGAIPIPTQYFALEESNIGSICGVAVTAKSEKTSTHRSRTAPVECAKGVRIARPVTGPDQPKTMASPQSTAPSNTNVKSRGSGHQRLSTPARVNTSGSKLRRPQSKLGKVIVAQPHLRDDAPRSVELNAATSSDELTVESPSLELHVDTSSDELTREKEHCFVVPDRVSATQVNKPCENKTEDIKFTTSPVREQSSPPNSGHPSVKESPQAKDVQLDGKTLRESIMGEIQRKIASLEADDERADQRDRELFLRHTSLHSGEWHLQRLSREDLYSDGHNSADQTFQDKGPCMDEEEEADDLDLDLRGDMTGLSMDLTSELSASGEHDLEHDDDDESTRPAESHTDEEKPESDNGSSDSHDDDRGDDSSFDFEDLVEAAESIDARDEDEEKHADTLSSPQRSIRLPSNHNPRLDSSHDKQPVREKRRGPPVPPRRIKPIVSPLIKSPRPESPERSVKPSCPIELSSSFSSRRLQSLLESTDWTAELNAQASSDPPSSHSSSKSSSRRSAQKPSQTTSSSSIELVYDPILRCYYDPVANKYYALAK
ncbi:hypothetical protein F441_09900 [Phytophthora nicotianae CJ01A1]|uniref:CFA20 domain-containing protein n=2 Tax=Phytophthora nicotianae TaxID=4792 RepID=W2GRB2_PHYNI|nr:hypothetical protein L915_09753 [Phytophthora nicotianae]ETL38847.1 hypothetical protein L916_09659 [Phytophthora nicotianae]ETP15253.1 hypothetical protein F441_09900 [Phytophthora nicotianae CJ01A1]